MDRYKFNAHVQRILDLKARAIDFRYMRRVGLGERERAELKRLEATLPNILSKEDLELFTKAFKASQKKAETIRVEFHGTITLKLCGT